MIKLLGYKQIHQGLLFRYNDRNFNSNLIRKERWLLSFTTKTVSVRNMLLMGDYCSLGIVSPSHRCTIPMSISFFHISSTSLKQWLQLVSRPLRYSKRSVYLFSLEKLFRKILIWHIRPGTMKGDQKSRGQDDGGSCSTIQWTVVGVEERENICKEEEWVVGPTEAAIHACWFLMNVYCISIMCPALHWCQRLVGENSI